MDLFFVNSNDTMYVFPFQNAIASHESNGIDIIIALILNDINPLGKQRMDLVLELKVRWTISITSNDLLKLFILWHRFVKEN